jgi:hypothetical protein
VPAPPPIGGYSLLRINTFNGRIGCAVFKPCNIPFSKI